MSSSSTDAALLELRTEEEIRRLRSTDGQTRREEAAPAAAPAA